jgi:FkbM family methyltransferase
MNFIDIGANVGAHTLYMSKLVGNNGKGFAFEPLSSHASILCFNLMNNQCFNTTVYQYGCSNIETNMHIEEKFTNTKKSTNFGAIVLQLDKKENDTTIQTIVLDSISLPRIDVVKIDAEGMEEQVILGMKQCIEKCRPVFIVEIHSENEKKMFELFTSMNYNIRQIEYSWDFFASPN